MAWSEAARAAAAIARKIHKRGRSYKTNRKAMLHAFLKAGGKMNAGQ